jgi:hypothetical protein
LTAEFVAMKRKAFILLATLALPACTLTNGSLASADIADQVADLSVGARCRVTLQPVEERATSSSQLTYEGIVERVSDEGLLLKEASIAATSRTKPPIHTNLPFVDRHFASVSIVEQSLDAPVRIPIAKIERVARL